MYQIKVTVKNLNHLKPSGSIVDVTSFYVLSGQKAYDFLRLVTKNNNGVAPILPCRISLKNSSGYTLIEELKNHPDNCNCRYCKEYAEQKVNNETAAGCN